GDGGARPDRVWRRVRCGTLRPAPGRRPRRARAQRGRPPRIAQRGVPGRHRAVAAPPRRAGDPVTRIVEIPTSFDDRAMDQFAAAFGGWPADQRLLFDARGTPWVPPYGFAAL